MDSGTRRAGASWWAAVLVFVSALAAATAYAGGTASGIGEAAAPPQDVTRIESRLGQLEQRFYSIEASIRGLEQQSRLSGVTAGRATRDPEAGLLRAEVEALRQRLAEVETLRRRLAEVECGLSKVDERTLSASEKQARRRPAQAAGDPCRLNADTPVRLPARP